MSAVVESLDDLITRYGSPHLWSPYICFVNAWRLIAETIQIRAFIDVALRCPIAGPWANPELRQLAADKFGKDFTIAGLDHEWPGQWCFEYDWEGLAQEYVASH